MSKHLFAVYLENYSNNKIQIVVNDPTTYHRITRVLRLDAGDELIIFDKQFNSLAKIKSVDKKKLTIEFQTPEPNKEVAPKLVLAIGMLKKDNFEDVVYSAVELGVNEIYPLVTDKSQKSKMTSKDKERLSRIMISAAEQSKNFSLPILCDPIKLPEFLRKDLDSQKVFLDVGGKNISSFADKVESTCLLVGPEGDFSEDEKEQIKSSGFEVAKLTPTVLRATQAVVVGVGFFRSASNT